MSATLHLLHPGPIDAPTGGSRYNQRMATALQGRGWAVRRHRVDGTWPQPGSAALEQYRQLLAGLPDDALTLVDGLVFCAAPAVAEAERERLRLVPIVHLPLAEETGRDAPGREQLRAGETRALACASHVLATSRFAAGLLGDYGVVPERVWAVEPGVDPVPAAQSVGVEPRLLCVAALTPRKAQDVLVEALAGLGDRAWRCELVGPLDHDTGFVAALRARIAEAGLQSRVWLRGVVTGRALLDVYADADLFVLPSRFETFGMVLTEALAHGLPVLSTRGGAIPETVPASAGRLVAPGDAVALRDALAHWLDTPDLRAQLRAGALEARDRLRGWDEQAAVLDPLLRGALA